MNRALPGMLAGAYEDGGRLTNGEPAAGAWHLERLIREDLADACTPVLSRVLPTPRRKVVIALGTNDTLRVATPGDAAGRAVLALYERVRRVPCVDVFVATIPPQRKVPAGKVALANVVIALRVPADHVIPFGSEAESDLGSDGVHMTEEGQQHRADLALGVLFPTGRAAR